MWPLMTVEVILYIMKNLHLDNVSIQIKKHNSWSHGVPEFCSGNRKTYAFNNTDIKDEIYFFQIPYTWNKCIKTIFVSLFVRI